MERTSLRQGEARRRRAGLLSLIASLSMVLVGLVGVGFASPASAATVTETADPIGTTTYWCPEGTSPVGEWEQGTTVDPGEDSCMGSEQVDKVKMWTCEKGVPAGWTQPYYGNEKPGKCVYQEEKSSNPTWVCPPGSDSRDGKCYIPCIEEDSISAEGGRDHGCQPTRVDKVPTCQKGEYSDGKCRWTEDKYTDPEDERVCPPAEELVLLSSEGHKKRGQCHDGGGDMCTVDYYVNPLTETTWACPVADPAYSPDGWDPATYEGSEMPGTCSRQVTTVDPASLPGGGDWFCVGGNNVAVSWAGAEGSADNELDIQVAVQANKDAAMAAAGVPAGTPAGQCEVEQPVTGPVELGTAAPSAVAPAQAATVKPAKKPAKAAAAPGSVKGGVAFVSAPAKATVPSAVPAGGGSEAPSLPVWAIALMVAGALGAAAAGRQLVGARK